jgi:hypothetical protein
MPPSPPAQNQELQDTMGKRPPSPPSIEQQELLPRTDRDTPQPLPSTQQSVYVTSKDSLSSDFYVSGQKVQNIDKNAYRQMFKALEPFRKEVLVDQPSKDSTTTVSKKFSCYEKYQHKEPLKDLRILGMSVQEFWEDGDKDHNEFEYEK